MIQEVGLSLEIGRQFVVGVNTVIHGFGGIMLLDTSELYLHLELGTAILYLNASFDMLTWLFCER